MVEVGSSRPTPDYSGDFGGFLLGHALCEAGVRIGSFTSSKFGPFEPIGVDTGRVWQSLKENMANLPNVDDRDRAFADAVLAGLLIESQDSGLHAAERAVLDRL